MEPSSRPSFQQMLNDRIFEKIAIQTIISDADGQKFWQINFVTKDHFGKYEVKLDELLKALVTFWNKPATFTLHDSYKCLAAILPEKFQTNPKQVPVIHISRFSAVLEWFGPFAQTEEFLEKIKLLLSKE